MTSQQRKRQILEFSLNFVPDSVTCRAEPVCVYVCVCVCVCECVCVYVCACVCGRTR
jgi:hypothetical protein